MMRLVKNLSMLPVLPSTATESARLTRKVLPCSHRLTEHSGEAE